MQPFIKQMCGSARKFNAITRTNIKRLFNQPNLLLDIFNFVQHQAPLLCSTILLNLPYKRMLRHRSALKKKQFVVHRSKKNSDCADITKIENGEIQIF